MNTYNGTIVHTESKELSLSQLKEMYDANDIITDPDYQRRYIYDVKRASSLIESVLIGIPIPIIYLCEEEENVYSVIDGQQRISSFVKFLKNEYPLSALSRLTKLNGKYFKNLDKKIQRKLNVSCLKIVCLGRESQDLKYEIFSRLNLGAVSLKPQELRNCIYRGSFNDMLKDIVSKNIQLAELFHDKNLRSTFEERILRFFVLRDSMILDNTYTNAMNRYMIIHQHDLETEIQKAKSLYNSTIDTVKLILGNTAFFSYDEKGRKKFNGAVYDSVMIPFSFYEKFDLINHADEIRKAVEKVKMTDEEYKNNVYAGTNSKKKVFGRISKIWSLLITIVGKNGIEKGNRFFTDNVKEQLFYKGCKCGYCGNEILSINDCEIDHVIPFSKGGSTDIKNAQLLHRYCNQIKSNEL